MVDGGALAGHAGQVGRQALAVAGVDQQRHLAVQQVGEVGHRVLHAVHGKGDVATVEVAAMQHTLAFGVDDGVVVGAVQLILDAVAEERQRVRQHADHVRRAADRITVLQALAVAFQLAGVLQVLAQPGRHVLHAGMRLHREQGFVEVVVVAVQRERGQRRDARDQARQVIGAVPGQAGQAGHYRGAVHQCKGFLGAQHQWLPAELTVHLGTVAALPLVHHFTFTGQGRGDVGQGRQVATGAHRAFFGDQRQDVVGQEVAQALQQHQAHTRYAMAQRA